MEPTPIRTRVPAVPAPPAPPATQPDVASASGAGVDRNIATSTTNAPWDISLERR